MTAKDAIEELSKYPSDMEILIEVFDCHSGGFHLETVDYVYPVKRLDIVANILRDKGSISEEEYEKQTNSRRSLMFSSRKAADIKEWEYYEKV